MIERAHLDGCRGERLRVVYDIAETLAHFEAAASDVRLAGSRHVTYFLAAVAAACSACSRRLNTRYSLSCGIYIAARRTYRTSSFSIFVQHRIITVLSAVAVIDKIWLLMSEISIIFSVSSLHGHLLNSSRYKVSQHLSVLCQQKFKSIRD